MFPVLIAKPADGDERRTPATRRILDHGQDEARREYRAKRGAALQDAVAKRAIAARKNGLRSDQGAWPMPRLEEPQHDSAHQEADVGLPR